VARVATDLLGVDARRATISSRDQTTCDSIIGPLASTSLIERNEAGTAVWIVSMPTSQNSARSRAASSFVATRS